MISRVLTADARIYAIHSFWSEHRLDSSRWSTPAIPTLPVPEIKALSLTKLHTSGGRRNM